jgi:outer membrane receptor protein involved in Fe transport
VFGLVIGSIVLAWPTAALAQATGAMTGVVSDTSGGVLPGVTVEATNQGTAQTRTVVTGSDGFYTIPLLSPGSYQVKAQLAGFRAAIRDDVVVVVNEAVRADFQLQVGRIEEGVTVQGQTPLVETTNATLGVVINRQQVVDLPLNGRNFAQLGTLIPGVIAPPSGLQSGDFGNATPGGFGNATGGFNVNGMRNQSNNFLMDGAENNDTFNTGFVLRPPPDAIEEFKILTHAYGAEYGRNAGSIVDVVTKSGSNAMHGDAWEFDRNDAFEARNFFAASKPTLKQNQFGGTLGGPLVLNRLFGFGFYEGFRNTQGMPDNRVVLTAAQQQGNFGTTSIRDPLSGLPFPNNTIPPERLNAISLALLNQYIALPNTGANRLVRVPDSTDDRNQFGTRFDYKWNDRHSILGRYMYSHTNQFNPLGGSNFSPAGNVATARLQDLLFSDTFVVSSNRINVARFGINRIDANPNVTSGLGLSNLGFNFQQTSPIAAGLPYITINGFFTMGDAQQPFASRTNNVVSFSDDYSWVEGAHSWKFGGQVRRDAISLAYINRPNGDFTFDGSFTGNTAADFLLGMPKQFRQGSGDPNLDGYTYAYAVYAQDDYRLSAHWTFNYGVRYELDPPFVDKADHLNAFHPGQQSTVFPNAPTGLVYPGDSGVPRGTYPTIKHNIAPRVAAVWDPLGDGRTSVRAAWGLFYDTLAGQGDFFQNGTLAPPFQPLTQVDFPLTQKTPTFANPLAGVGGAPGFPAGLIFIGWGPDFTTPVVSQYNVTLQRQIGERLGVEAGYVGSRGYHLPIFMEVNPTLPILSPAPKEGPRLFPAFSLVRPTFTVADSWYNALQSSVRMRPLRGFNFLASYTLSHAIDDLSGLNIGGEPRPMLPVTIGDQTSIDAALAREKGDALFDVRHRFVLSFGYELPLLGGQQGVIRAVLGGWQLNGIVQAQTGFPLTAIEPTDVALTSLTNRPNVICDPNANASHTVSQWFDASCFQRLTLTANAGQIGNEPRNAIRGPGLKRTDLSLFKNVVVRRGQQVQLRVEAFNLFNQAHFGQPGNQIGTPTFGLITTADPGRIVQLGVKYTF